MSRVVSLGSRWVYRGRVVHLAIERLRLPNGEDIELEVVHHQGAAAAVPLDGQGRVHLVRQYRHAVRGWLLEVPAGKLDGGEAPESCALREVEEEVGQRPRRLVPMGSIRTTPGFSDERIWLYLALDLEPAPQALERDELLSVETMTLERALDLARTGEIEDAKSVCALLRVASFLEGVVSGR